MFNVLKLCFSKTKDIFCIHDMINFRAILTHFPRTKKQVMYVVLFSLVVTMVTKTNSSIVKIVLCFRQSLSFNIV